MSSNSLAGHTTCATQITATPRASTKSSEEAEAQHHNQPHSCFQSDAREDATVAYRYSHHSLCNPRRFAEGVKSAKLRIYTHKPAPSYGECTSAQAAVPSHCHRWRWRCPYVLPFALTRAIPQFSGSSPFIQQQYCDVTIGRGTPASSVPRFASPTPTNHQPSPTLIESTATLLPQRRQYHISDQLRSPSRAADTPTAAEAVPFSADAATALIRDLQRQLYQLQVCVEGMQTGATHISGGAATLPSYTLASAAETALNTVSPPDCDLIVGRKSTLLVPAVLTETNTTAVEESPVECASVEEKQSTTAAKPSMLTGVEAQERQRPASQQPLVSSLCLPSLTSCDLTDEAVARLREYLKDLVRGEEEVSVNASTPSPTAVAANAVGTAVIGPTPTSAPSPTAPVRHSRQTGGIIAAGGAAGGGHHNEDFSVLSASALSSRVTDAASTAVSVLDRYLDKPSRRKSWMEAVEAAARNIFVEGDDGRPVTSLKRRVVMVAPPALSSLKTQPSFDRMTPLSLPEGEQQQSQQQHQVCQSGEGQDTKLRSGERGRHATSDLTQREGAYGTLDVYMWHQKSPLEARAAPADARPFNAGSGSSTGGAGVHRESMNNNNGETSLLMASTASAVIPSLATTVTSYALPGEDCGLLLTSPLEVSAETLTSTEEMKHLTALQHVSDARQEPTTETCEAHQQPAISAAPAQEFVCEAVKGEDVQLQRLERSAQSSATSFSVATADAKANVGLLAQVPETSREVFPLLVTPAAVGAAVTVSTSVNSAQKHSNDRKYSVTNEGAEAATKRLETEQDRRALQRFNSLTKDESSTHKKTLPENGSAATAQKEAVQMEANNIETRPITAFPRSRGRAAAKTEGNSHNSDNKTDAVGFLPSAPPPLPPDARRCGDAVDNKRRRRLLICDAVELPEVRTTTTMTTTTTTTSAQEASVLTEPSFGPSATEPSPLLLQQVAAYQVLMETAPPLPANHDGVDNRATPSKMPSVAEAATAGVVPAFMKLSKCNSNSSSNMAATLSSTTATEVKPLLVVQPTVTVEAGPSASVVAAHRGSNSARTGRSSTVSAGDLSAPSGLSETKFSSFPSGYVRSNREANKDGGEGCDHRAITLAAEPEYILPLPLYAKQQLPPSTPPGELSEVLRQQQQQQQARQNTTSGYTNGEGRRSSEISWYTVSLSSPSRILTRPGAPSPAATPHRSLHTSTAHFSSRTPSPYATASQKKGLSALLTSQSLVNAGVGVFAEEKCPPRYALVDTSPTPTATFSADISSKPTDKLWSVPSQAPPDDSSVKKREMNTPVSFSTSPPSLPSPPTKATSACSTVLPALAPARPYTTGVAPKRKTYNSNTNTNGSKRNVSSPIHCRPCSTSSDSPAVWLGGTSVLTTGQYRVWKSINSNESDEGTRCRGALPQRISSTPVKDGFRQQIPSVPFGAASRAVRTPTRPATSLTHYASRSPVEDHKSAP